jgi:hypothetical protein
MKKSDFDKNFVQMVANDLQHFAGFGMIDKPMICQFYSDTKDTAQKSKEITAKQYYNWITPKQALNLNYLKRL